MSLLSPFQKSLLCWGILLASPVVNIIGAEVIPQGSETALIGSRIGDQTAPNAAITGNGGFLVWQDNSVTSLGARIRAQQLDANLTAFKSPIVVSSVAKSKTAGFQERPKVGLLPDGGAVVVWQGGKIGLQQVYARFISSAGVPLKSDIRVSTKTKLNQADPVVAVLSDGTVLVVWSSFGQDGNMWGIFAQRFTSTGAKIGAEFQVNQVSAYNQRNPAVAAMANGRFIVAWISDLQRGSASVDVYARIFGPSDSGNEFPVNGTTNCPCANPTVAASSQGGFAIAWSQKETARLAIPSDPNDPTGIYNPAPNLTGTTLSPASWDVYGRFYDDAGNPVSEPSVLNAYTYGDQFVPSLSSSGSNYFAVWTSLAQDGDDREGVFGRLLSGNGQTQGDELHINMTTVSRQFQPFVTSNGENLFLTLWSGFVKRNGFDVFSQIFQLSTP